MLVHLFVYLLVNLNQVGILMLFCCNGKSVNVGQKIDRLIAYSL